MTTPNEAPVVITKAHREDGLAELIMLAGEHEIQTLVVKAYALGRRHGREE